MEAARKPEGREETADMVQDDPWVTLKKAAELRGRDRITVLNETLDGRIRSRKVAGRRVFHRDDLERLRRELDGESPTDQDANSHGND